MRGLSRRSWAVLGGLAVIAAGALLVVLPGSGRAGSGRTFLDRRVAATAAPLAGSAAMVEASLLPFVATANVASSNAWAVPVVVASERDPIRSIALRPGGYGPGGPLRFRVPAWAQPSTGSDHHLAVLDGDRELDLWTATRRRDGDLDAGARTIVTTPRPVAGPIAATASGFTLTAGLLRPEEIAAGRIDHALTFTTPYVRVGFTAPAVHSDGRQTDPGAMPMGTHIQLDPRADISALPRPVRVIARALQQYGAYLVDTGGSLAIRAESPLSAGPSARTPSWASVGLADASLARLPWARMRVVSAA